MLLPKIHLLHSFHRCFLPAGKDASFEVTKSTAIFLFEMLQEASFVGQPELAKIGETFGPCDRSVIDEAHKLTQVLLSNIPDDELNKNLLNSTRKEHIKAFGEGIKFFYPNVVEFETEFTLFEHEIEDEKPKFSFKLNTEEIKAESFKIAQENHDGGAPMQDNEHAVVSWLKRRCDYYFGDTDEHLSSADMCSVIFDLLTSPKGNQEMQNELFELLGFDRFDFIEELLSNREHILTNGAAREVDTSSGKKSKSNLL